MPPSYLSDADVWVCICYTALARQAASPGIGPLDGAACDCVARALWRDPAYQSLDPELAARTYLHARTAPAE